MIKNFFKERHDNINKSGQCAEKVFNNLLNIEGDICSRYISFIFDTSRQTIPD